MARGVYDASVSVSSLTAGRTLVLITAPATACVEIVSAHITNATLATNEQHEACWQLVNALGTPTATTLTPTKTEQGDQAAQSTVKGNVTGSEPTYVANTQVDRQGYPCLTGYHHLPEQQERIVIAPGATWGLRLLTSSPTSHTLDACVRFREIG